MSTPVFVTIVVSVVSALSLCHLFSVCFRDLFSGFVSCRFGFLFFFIFFLFSICSVFDQFWFRFVFRVVLFFLLLVFVSCRSISHLFSFRSVPFHVDMFGFISC